MCRQADPGMTNSALIAFRRSLMTAIAVLAPPASGVRTRMRAQVRRMANRAAGPRAGAGVTPVTVGLTPVGGVIQRAGGCVTGFTGILLVTRQAAFTVPGGIDSMDLQPPQVVMVGRHRDLVTILARCLGVTDGARIVCLHGKIPVSTRPVLVMTARRSLRIHIFVAGEARLA